MDNKTCNLQDAEVRKGPWTVEEDMILINHISNNGRGVWNSLARSSGLRRSGKSCRLRWLNYLRPGVKRGNITPDEELLIMELHEKWGNSWSKIAKHLPGRTDNEVKNYWRTRIQKRMNQSGHHDEPKSDEQHHHFQATTSGTAGEADAAEPYSILPPLPYPNNSVQSSSTSDSAALPNATPATTTDSYDNFWCLDDLWPSDPPNFDT